MQNNSSKKKKTMEAVSTNLCGFSHRATIKLKACANKLGYLTEHVHSLNKF